MFNGIKDKVKLRAAKKFLETELKKPITVVERPGGISKIACLVDLDTFNDTNLFFEFIEDYALRPNAINIIGYKSFYDKNSPYATPVFSDKDLGWNGNIENSYVLEFLSRDYDLLVNYYNKDNLLLNLMSLKTNARVRVGFAEVDLHFNDLIINSPIKDFKTFKKELGKYLKVLNEIKK